MLWIIIIAGVVLMGMKARNGARADRSALHKAACARVPQTELISYIREECGRIGCPVDVALVTADAESSIHNDRYNKAYRNGVWYAHRRLETGLILKSGKAREWYEASPLKSDPSAWGSYGVWQVHPQWLWEHIPKGVNHDSYMGDHRFTTPLQLAKLKKMYQDRGCIVNVRLRYLGWETAEVLLPLYPIAAGKTREQRSLTEQRAVTAVTLKIPKWLKAFNTYKSGSKFWPTTAMANLYSRLKP